MNELDQKDVDKDKRIKLSGHISYLLAASERTGATAGKAGDGPVRVREGHNCARLPPQWARFLTLCDVALSVVQVLKASVILNSQMLYVLVFAAVKREPQISFASRYAAVHIRITRPHRRWKKKP